MSNFLFQLPIVKILDKKEFRSVKSKQITQKVIKKCHL